jgi:hypothetical protein
MGISKRMKLVYDVKAVPGGLDIGNLVKIYEMHNVIFWDSSKEGVKPKLYGVDGHEAPLAVVDTKGKEIDLESYSKEFAEVEFWKKELHNCKNSPIYFWANYGTSVWPHKSSDMSAYLKSIGMDEVVAKDDEDAKKLWEKQKAKVKIATDKYTIEFLKDRKAIVDIVKNKYDERVISLQRLLKDYVSLHDKDGTELAPRKQVANIMEKIRKSIPVHPAYSDSYRTKKGKWDIPMLLVTNYDKLLEILYEVLKADGKLKELVGPASGDKRGTDIQS